MNTNKQKIKKKRAWRRKNRVRAKVSGTAEKPRLSVFRSLKKLYLQLINDQSANTLASVSSDEIKKKGTKTEIAFQTGQLLAEKARKKGIETAVFDKGPYKYHGRVKAAAEGARQGGLKF